jgi:hypothetical protein
MFLSYPLYPLHPCSKENERGQAHVPGRVNCICEVSRRYSSGASPSRSAILIGIPASMLR